MPTPNALDLAFDLPEGRDVGGGCARVDVELGVFDDGLTASATGVLHDQLSRIRHPVAERGHGRHVERHAGIRLEAVTP